MGASKWVVVIGAFAVGCTTTVRPIGNFGGEGGSAGGGAGAAGAFPVDASLAGEGGSAGFGGFAGSGFVDSGVAGAAGYVGGYGGAAGGWACDDGDPCTQDSEAYGPDLIPICLHTFAPELCGMAGSGGYAGGMPTDGGIAGVGGFAGSYAGSGGFGGYGGGIAGSGGYAGGYAGSGGYGGCGEMDVDQDGDGYTNTFCGGDCDDSDSNAFPYQSNFYPLPRSSGGYDYDCDGQVTLRWGVLHSGCALDPSAQSCIGSGWTADDMSNALPGCGQTGTYAFCQFTGTDCGVSMHIVTQSCR